MFIDKFIDNVVSGFNKAANAFGVGDEDTLFYERKNHLTRCYKEISSFPPYKSFSPAAALSVLNKNGSALFKFNYLDSNNESSYEHVKKSIFKDPDDNKVIFNYIDCNVCKDLNDRVLYSNNFSKLSDNEKVKEYNALLSMYIPFFANYMRVLYLSLYNKGIATYLPYGVGYYYTFYSNIINNAYYKDPEKADQVIKALANDLDNREKFIYEAKESPQPESSDIVYHKFNTVFHKRTGVEGIKEGNIRLFNGSKDYEFPFYKHADIVWFKNGKGTNELPKYLYCYTPKFYTNKRDFTSEEQEQWMSNKKLAVNTETDEFGIPVLQLADELGETDTIQYYRNKDDVKKQSTLNEQKTIEYWVKEGNNENAKAVKKGLENYLDSIDKGDVPIIGEAFSIRVTTPEQLKFLQDTDNLFVGTLSEILTNHEKLHPESNAGEYKYRQFRNYKKRLLKAKYTNDIVMVLFHNKDDLKKYCESMTNGECIRSIGTIDDQYTQMLRVPEKLPEFEFDVDLEEIIWNFEYPEDRFNHDDPQYHDWNNVYDCVALDTWISTDEDDEQNPQYHVYD